MDYDHDFSHGNHELEGKYFQSRSVFLFLYLLSSSRCKSSNLIRRTSLFAQNVPNVVHPVTDSLETEIEQHGKVVISTEMDASCPAILIGTFSCGMLRLKHTWWPTTGN